jgi:hypothetical protein
MWAHHLGRGAAALGARGWLGGQRDRWVANDDDPQRLDRLARLRCVLEPLKRHEALVCAGARDIHLSPTVGSTWLPTDSQVEVMTPGQNHKHSWFGALDPTTGTLLYCLGACHTNALFRDLLDVQAARDPAEPHTPRSVGVDHEQLHTARAVVPWLTTYPWCLGSVGQPMVLAPVRWCVRSVMWMPAPRAGSSRP